MWQLIARAHRKLLKAHPLKRNRRPWTTRSRKCLMRYIWIRRRVWRNQLQLPKTTDKSKASSVSTWRNWSSRKIWRRGKSKSKSALKTYRNTAYNSCPWQFQTVLNLSIRAPRSVGSWLEPQRKSTRNWRIRKRCRLVRASMTPNSSNRYRKWCRRRNGTRARRKWRRSMMWFSSNWIRLFWRRIDD